MSTLCCDSLNTRGLVVSNISYRGWDFNPYEESENLKNTTAKVDRLETVIWTLTAQIEALNQALEKLDAELCKYKPALELGMMYVAKQEFEEALKRV